MIDLLLLQDPEPWFSTETATYFGAIGAICGVMVPKGKGRSFILPMLLVLACLGVVVLGVGVVALVLGQPYAIWYPFMLLGFIPAVVFGSLDPGMKRLYAQAEQRQLEADALRRS
jgi:peptidoglycan/LPS O-acetylase OafA/YrhL